MKGIGISVSIPERVLEALKLQHIHWIIEIKHEVSIPERVLEALKLAAGQSAKECL